MVALVRHRRDLFIYRRSVFTAVRVVEKKRMGNSSERGCAILRAVSQLSGPVLCAQCQWSIYEYKPGFLKTAYQVIIEHCCPAASVVSNILMLYTHTAVDINTASRVDLRFWIPYKELLRTEDSSTSITGFEVFTTDSTGSFSVPSTYVPVR